MNLEDLIYLEDLKVKSGDEAIDSLFRNKLSQVFSPSFLKKIDRVFNTTIKLKDFEKNNNVMCYTQGTKIYVNNAMFNSVPKEKAMNYIMHEMFHVLNNTGRFPELERVNEKLLNMVIRGVPRGKESDFLTGKHQNIHSDWRGECINYLCNNSINWDIAIGGMKIAYKTVLKESGLFNMDSPFWKERFGDTEALDFNRAKKITKKRYKRSASI